MSAAPLVVILMGSGADREHCGKIAGVLAKLGVDHIQRVGSGPHQDDDQRSGAHSTPTACRAATRRGSTGYPPGMKVRHASRSKALM